MWLKNFVISNRYFFFPFFGFLLSGAMLLILFTKAELLIAVNSRHNYLGDIFFKYYTHVGDGNFYLVLAALCLLFVSKHKAIVMVASYAFSSIPAQLIKHYLPGGNFRPRAYFWLDYKEKLHFVDGVEIMVSNSFPSGHTTSAFSMFLVFSYFAKKKQIGLAYFFMALLVGYSRMYLGQHFFADIIGGSILATIFTTIVIFVSEKKLNLSASEKLKNGLLV